MLAGPNSESFISKKKKLLHKESYLLNLHSSPKNNMSAPKDLSHLLSVEAKSRKSSPLKTAFKYLADPNVVFLGGGLPLADYFPWTKVIAESPAAPFADGIGAYPKEGEAVITEVHRDPKSTVNLPTDIPLSRSLQYGFTEGQPEIIKFVTEHTKLIHKIPYEGWTAISTIGNTEAWDSVLRTFTNRGDTILVEGFTFSSALETAHGLGVTTYPTPVDDFGIIPEKLEEILNDWVGPKPKLLYTIPTGQNPTGSSLSNERRVEIYKIAQEHDLLIIEDEPYYFLQMEPYTKDVSKRSTKSIKNHQEFIDGLVTSFLSLDVDGRVLRLDSFSKVLAPGSRFGWIVGQEYLLERIVRLHEVSVQNPAGFTQTLINGLLQRWGQDGYIDWLIGLRAEYSLKRDVAIDAVEKYFPKEVSFYNPPVAGMFFTVQFDAAKHPKFEEFGRDPLKVEAALFDEAIKEGSLMIPGSWFKVTDQTNPPQPETHADKSTENHIFFRGTYAAVPLPALQDGLEKFAKAVKVQFGL